MPRIQLQFSRGDQSRPQARGIVARPRVNLSQVEISAVIPKLQQLDSTTSSAGHLDRYGDSLIGQKLEKLKRRTQESLLREVGSVWPNRDNVLRHGSPPGCNRVLIPLGRCGGDEVSVHL